ncbi:MAG TPA: glutaredoxin family protein [Planctomycetaceae bacterium]
MNTDHTSNSRQTAGLIALAGGSGLLLLVLLDSAYSLPWEMPATWYLHRTLWGAVALALCATGWRLQRQTHTGAGTWKPAAAGRRFTRLVVYSRPECHLCDDAKAFLADYAEYLPRIEDVDIDSDPELQTRYGESIPVVEIDGEIRFRGRVDEILLRRMIEATPPF